MKFVTWSKHMSRRALLMIPVAALVVIAGCINYEQTTKLNLDGSGTAEIHYWAEENSVSFLSSGPLYFDEAKIKEQYKGTGITAKDIKMEMKEADSTRHVNVTVEFKNIQELSKTEAFKGIAITWAESEGNMKFEQKMEPRENSSSMGMDQYTITYVYDMPGEVVSSNATKVEGSKLTWTYKLSDLSKEVILSASVKKGGMMSNTLIIVIIVAGVVILIVVIVVMKKKKPSAGQPPASQPPTPEPPAPQPPQNMENQATE